MSDDLVGALTAVVAVVTLPLGVLSLFFVGWEVAMVVFVVGWFLLTPLIPIVGGHLLPAVRETRDGPVSEDETADPLEELKRRYARGEIDDREFERRVGSLVETEDVEVDGDAAFDGDANLGHLAERDAETEGENADRLRE